MGIWELIDSLNTTKTAKKIRPFDLKWLGYTFSKRKVKLSGDYILCEMLDSDTRQPATFCFLLDTMGNVGIVLPATYAHCRDTRKDKLLPNRVKDRV